MNPQASVAALAAGVVSYAASAGVVLTAVEVGPDVVISGGGTLDFSAWVQYTNSDSAAIAPEAVIVGDQGPTFTNNGYQISSGVSGPPAFTTGPVVFADSAAGDIFGILPQLGGSAADAIAPNGYVSGDPLAGSATFLSQSFATLGLNPGTYTFTWPTASGGSDFFSLVVPSPGAGAVFVVLGVTLRRRR